MSDTLKEELSDPQSAIMIAIVDGQVHLAYSLDLTGKPNEILDILETAAMMVLSEMTSSEGNPIH